MLSYIEILGAILLASFGYIWKLKSTVKKHEKEDALFESEVSHRQDAIVDFEKKNKEAYDELMDSINK